MQKEIVVRFRMGETQGTSLRGQYKIRVQMLEEVLGEGSMPKRFFKGNLVPWGEPKGTNGEMVESGGGGDTKVEKEEEIEKNPLEKRD